MIKKIFWILCLGFGLWEGYGQNISLSGSVTNAEDSTFLEGAEVRLTYLPDSVQEGKLTDSKGAFLLENLKKGNYILNIRYLGYRDYNLLIQLETSRNLGKIALEPETVSTGEVRIVGKVPSATQLGDTTQYNAKAFKVNPDANAEDLVLKMPAMTQQNGKIQAQGEDVKQVTVNGKPFFGDDPNAVLKNIPAEMIDKIQVFDRQSDQSRFTGFDDGNSSKTINIVMKPEFVNGLFGRVYSGYGTEDRYKAGGNLNYFKKDRRISLVGLSNNINEQNFSSDDLMGVMSSTAQSGGRGGPGGGRGGMGGGRRDQMNPSESFLSNIQNGLVTAHAAGLNYVDKWGKKAEVAGSYFFNLTQNQLTSNLFRQYVTAAQAGQVYEEQGGAENKNQNHRLNFRMEYTIDSMKSFVINPRFSFQGNHAFSNQEGNILSDTSLLNLTQNQNRSDGAGFSFTNSLLYRQKLAKRGRTFSVSVNHALNDNSSTSSLLAQNTFFQSSFPSDTLNQNTRLFQNSSSVGGNVSYTEPLGKKLFLQFSWGLNYNTSSAEKKTVETPSEILDSTLSGSFENLYLTQTAGAGLRYQQPRSSLSGDVNYQWAKLSNNQLFPYEYSMNHVFNNILPSVRYMYRISQQQSLRVSYRTSTNVPSVTQLQEVVNNTNPLILSTGNQNLKQAYTHTLMSRFSKVNTEKSSSVFFMVNGAYTHQYIGNSVSIASRDTIIYGVSLARGSQLSRPVNLNGYGNIKMLLTYGFPVAPLKSNLNLSLSLNYLRTPGLINNELNLSHSPNAGVGIVLGSNISPELDFTVSSNTSLNYVLNTLQKELNSFYLNQQSRFRVNYILKKHFVFQSDITHNYNAGLSSAFNQHFFVWNMGAGYKFLKNNNADIRIVAFDLLKQNNYIQRNLTETYIEDTQLNALTRYFMLVFTYNFKKPFGKK